MKKRTLLFSAIMAGAMMSQAGDVILDYTAGGYSDGDTNIFLSYPSGISGVTALFTSDLPKGTNGADSAFRPVGNHGLAIQGGVDSNDIDSGENYRLRIQLYTGYDGTESRGTEVTDDYPITLKQFTMRQRQNALFGLEITDGTITNTSVLSESGLNPVVTHDIEDMNVEAPLTVTSITPASGVIVQEIQTMTFYVTPLVSAVTNTVTLWEFNSNGDTEGWGINLQAGDMFGFRYDKATVPQARDLPTVDRETWMIWVNPLGFCAD